MIVTAVYKCGCHISRMYSDKINKVSLCWGHLQKFQRTEWYNTYIGRVIEELKIDDKKENVK